MNRYNIFDIPHKGIRNAVMQLSMLAGNTDYTSLKQVIRLYNLASDVFKILRIHAKDENEIILKKLEDRMPGGGNHDYEEHDYIEFAQKQLEIKMKEILQNANEGNDVTEMGNEFYRMINDFYADYLKHMAEEENITQKNLWNYFKDEELLEIRKEIISKNSTEIMLIWFKFILPALNPAEKEKLLNSIKNLNRSNPITHLNQNSEDKDEEFLVEMFSD